MEADVDAAEGVVVEVSWAREVLGDISGELFKGTLWAETLSGETFLGGLSGEWLLRSSFAADKTGNSLLSSSMERQFELWHRGQNCNILVVPTKLHRWHL